MDKVGNQLCVPWPAFPARSLFDCGRVGVGHVTSSAKRTVQNGGGGRSGRRKRASMPNVNWEIAGQVAVKSCAFSLDVLRWQQ